MSRPDSTAAAQLDQPVVKPVWIAFMDFDGDEVRANTSGADITFTGTGDPDLDGYTFVGISAALVDISSVKSKQGGSDTVTAKLSGIPSLDGVMDVIGDRTKWQGRVARLWRIVRNASNVQQGVINPYYTGYMTSASIDADGESQSVTISIETYLAAFRGPSNRTYLTQERYDSGDLSAKAAIAIANGNSGSPLTQNTDSTPSYPGAIGDRLPYGERGF